MKKLLFIILSSIIYFASFAQTLTVSAGSNVVINRRNSTGLESQARVIATISGGTAPYTIAWRRLTSVSNSTICNIIDPTNDTTDIVILPYKAGGYDIEVQVTDAAATVKKDTVNVSVNWGSTPPQRTTLRKATASDTLAINAVDGVGYCKINDIIIDGANDGENIGGNKTDIYINGFGALGALVGGQNILIKGSLNYGNIDIILSDAGTGIDTTTFTYGSNGLPTNPIVVKPYGGQLKCSHLGFKNVIGFKVTGRTVAGKTGHLNGNYAFSRGTYGIWIDNAWSSLSGHCLSFEGNYGCRRNEIEFVEAGNGQFSGIFFKNDNSTIDWNYNVIHDNYIHDTHGEMFYKGSAAVDPQPLHNYNLVYNNRFCYGGNEGIQFGQQGIGNKVYNNIVINAANNWKATFQADQMFGFQMGVRNGGQDWYNNIMDGSSEQLISFFLYSKSGYASNNDTVKIRNSVFLHSTSWIAAYFGGSGVTGVKVLIDSVFIGKHNYKGSEVFTSHANTNDVFRGVNNYKMIIRNSVRDNTKTTWVTNNTGSNLDTSNLSVATLSFPQYANSGWGSNFDPSTIDRWADTIWNTWGDEYAGQGEKQNQPINYALGDTVVHMGKYYTSKVNNNHKHPPQGVTDAYWTLLTWTDGDSTYYYPPDDYRLSSTDPYALRGIGLLDQASSNQSPSANAGTDQTITLPTNSVTVNGSGTDPDGTIASYAWTKVSGGAASITSPSSASTSITGLVQGVYVFRLTVTDNHGATATDDVTVTVSNLVIRKRVVNWKKIN